jgi:hypothetical protein
MNYRAELKLINMKKISSQNSPLYHSRKISSRKKMGVRSQDLFPSIDGSLSFYYLKSFSKIPVLENIMVNGVLKEDGILIIYFNEKEFINVPSDIKENLKYEYGLSTVLFPDALFFEGSFMDGFSYDHLSEEISTYIVNGNIVPFNKAQRASSIGKLKKIEGVIHLNSSLIIRPQNNEFTKPKKYSKLNLIGIDISMQFKKGAA